MQKTLSLRKRSNVQSRTGTVTFRPVLEIRSLQSLTQWAARLFGQVPVSSASRAAAKVLHTQLRLQLKTLLRERPKAVCVRLAFLSMSQVLDVNLQYVR